MGTLGFLLPFRKYPGWACVNTCLRLLTKARRLVFAVDVVSFKTALKDLIESRVSLLLRMRLQHSIHDSDGSRLVAPDGSTHGKPQSVDPAACRKETEYLREF